MKYLFSFMLIFSGSVGHAGFPVLDVLEGKKLLADTAFMGTSLVMLLEEAGLEGDEAQALAQMSEESRLLQTEIERYQSLGAEVDSVSKFDLNRSQSIAHRVRDLAGLLRQLKTLTDLSIAASPEALSASLEVFEQNKRKKRESFQMKMMALDQSERMAEKRRRITERINRKETIERELAIIDSMSRRSPIKAIKIVGGNSRAKESSLFPW